MKRWHILALIVACFWALLSSAAPIQPYPLQWQRTYAGASNDIGHCIALAPDGGYLLAGESVSGVGLDKQTTNYGGNDGWVVRIDAQGNKLWERSFGGTGGDHICDVKLTIDGGWIFVAGSGSGPSGNKTSPTFGGQEDYWVVRIDDNGNKLWEKSFGGGFIADIPHSILALPDGGFLVGGSSQSNTNEVKTVPQFTTDLYYGDIWILRLDQRGEILWQRAYGGNHSDWLGGLDVCGTNGFIIAGTSQSPAGTGNKESLYYGSFDFWILLVDQEGNKIWERSYGGDNQDEAFNIRCTSDGGFVVCGWTGSGISGNKSTPMLNGGLDTWVIRLDSNGEKIWEQTVGTSFTDLPLGLQQTLDSGFIVAGSVFAGHGWGLLVRLDQNGNKVWERIYEDSNNGIALLDIQNTPDGGIIAAGHVWTPATRLDALLMKFGPDALTAPHLQLLPDTQRLILSGITGHTYVTEASADFVGWTPFATNTLSSNSMPVIDPAPTAAKRFYRALMRP